MGQLRIIAGKWKRRPIPVKALTGLRPTPDRVRETLFNWLGQRCDGWRCLDLFAGSGALGLEAASRGAARVVFVESDAGAAQAIEQWIHQVGGGPECQVVRAKAQQWCGTPASAGFDLIFIDPPFGSGMVSSIVPAAARLLVPGGHMYVESEAPVEAAWAASLGLSALRADKAGAVHYHLLQFSASQGAHDADRNLSRHL
jgi:16S rRNA (guanine(966)-N(2))-methyltransferase RsmD